MMNIASLIKHLQLFEDNRKKSVSSFPSPEKRVDYADAIAKCFIPCAKRILAGHFEVKNNVDGANITREIYPTVIELYYHEENDGGFQDPIMYHTDYRKRSELKAKRETYFTLTGLDSLPYYPIGSLNPHTSGIDVTFENSEKHYRASFLIREYKVIYENKKERTVENSTEIYDDLLLKPWTMLTGLIGSMARKKLSSKTVLGDEMYRITRETPRPQNYGLRRRHLERIPSRSESTVTQNAR